MDSDGNIAYQINANKLNGVIGAHISLKNGTDLAQVFNSYVGEIQGIIAPSNAGYAQTSAFSGR
jgi:hypothetical protein